jgi:hypothetical protein
LEKDILMANIKISDLTPAAAVLGTQEFEVNDSLTSKKVTAAQMLSYINANSGAVDLTSAQTITGVKTFSQPIVGSVTGSAATATDVTGTVAVANGGTGATTLTANNVLLGNGTSALQVVAPGTSGNVLTSNGTTWISDVLPASGLGIGQTWQAVTRTPGVTYTNTTGKPICFLMIMIGGSGSNQQVDLTIGATTLDYFVFSYFLNGVVQGQNMAIIPDGSTYSYTSTGNTTRDVYELR